MPLDNVTLELIIGAVFPLAIDFVAKYVKSSLWRYVVSLVSCLGVGALLNLSNLNTTDILGSGAIVFATAQTVYKTYWKDSDARTSLYGKSIHQD